ncbi:hypothetical protein NDU88_004554 [Pleurodeles waltl]|uniref:Uncharacterized protein n=1 Tax=Pleurodeles waltl TaxID=8319 RepID=A0AAV7PGF0_PLEWA|nr:hypothetical protein NDU88_004554 [Pleurodeles waltl]
MSLQRTAVRLYFYNELQYFEGDVAMHSPRESHCGRSLPESPRQDGCSLVRICPAKKTEKSFLTRRMPESLQDCGDRIECSDQDGRRQPDAVVSNGLERCCGDITHRRSYDGARHPGIFICGGMVMQSQGSGAVVAGWGLRQARGSGPGRA